MAGRRTFTTEEWKEQAGFPVKKTNPGFGWEWI